MSYSHLQRQRRFVVNSVGGVQEAAEYPENFGADAAGRH
jgi:hypothetical protein